jgi:hypothetical protein
MKNYAKNFAILRKFSWDMHRVPPNPNIKVDIPHSAVVLRSIIPPRHLGQLKARAIPLI